MNWFTHALSDAGHWLGNETDKGAHAIGGVLSDVGLGQAGQWVDNLGDRVANKLDPEMELGQTDDPTQLIHGDPAAIRASAGTLGSFSDAFGRTAVGLTGLDTSHWTGDAADAFREKYAPQPPRWQSASTASGSAGNALGGYADTVEWAQGQAKSAIQMYAEGQQATSTAVTAYNDQVGAYNAQAKTYNTLLAAGQDPGPEPVPPGPFTDPGAGLRQQAQTTLSDARAARDAAGNQAVTVVSSATGLAPAEPGFWSQVGDDFSDLGQGYQLAQASLDAGIVNGVADIGKFARTINPYDPWNITHPAEYLAGLSGTAAGLVHDVVNPQDLVGQILGGGWSSDPFESLGRLVPQVALVAATAGAGGAADAGADAAADAGADTAVNIGVKVNGIPDLTTYGPAGQEAQSIIDQYGANVRYTNSGGSSYDASTNTITIDTTNGDPGITLIHEATHVQWEGQGLHLGGATGVSRADYVGTNLSEETSATVRQIQANQWLQQGGARMPPTALQPEYEAGYQSGVQQAAQAAAAQGKVLTPDELAAAGRNGGWQAVNDAFTSGNVIGSVTGKPYLQTLGDYWDQVNQPPPIPPISTSGTSP